MLNEEVEVIVNDANVVLRHREGLAKEICEAGGPEI